MRPETSLPSVWTDAVRVSQLAWIIALAVLIPAGIGLWVDRVFGTTPWAILVGALVGTMAATVGVTRRILRRYEELAPSAPRGHGQVQDQSAEEDKRA